MWQDGLRTISLNLEVHRLSTGHYPQDTVVPCSNKTVFARNFVSTDQFAFCADQYDWARVFLRFSNGYPFRESSITLWVSVGQCNAVPDKDSGRLLISDKTWTSPNRPPSASPPWTSSDTVYPSLQCLPLTLLSSHSGLSGHPFNKLRPANTS
jgi:hypothetical protein